MKKYSGLICVLLVLLLNIGCSGEKYILIEQDKGISSYLDIESINYSKDADIASFVLKSTYDQQAKARMAAAWRSDNGINPFVESDYTLYNCQMRINKQELTIREVNYLDKNNKTVLRRSVNNTTSWDSIKGVKWMEAVYKEVTKRIDMTK